MQHKVWEEVSFEKFQNGCQSGQLEYQNGTNLHVAIPNHVALVPQTKFWLIPIQLNLCKNGNSLKDQTLIFQTNYRLMQVKIFAECSKLSILQYFRPLLTYHMPYRSLFWLFLSGRFTQFLLYVV